jgi:hypothetical protein
MKNLFEGRHRPVRQHPGGPHKEILHFSLLAFVHLAFSHLGTRSFEVFSFQVSNQQAILAQKQRIVTSTGLAQSRQHFRPYCTMPVLALLDPFGLDL